MSSHASARAAKPDGHSLAYNLGALALGAAAIGLALAYGIDGLARADRQPAADDLTVTRSLSGRELTIPGSWLRAEPTVLEGFAKQIELAIAVPLGPGESPITVAVTLLPRSQVRPSSSLLDGVYLHQFMPEQLNGPPGLIGKPLMAVDGYAGETVWYDPLASNPFVAKCMTPVGAEAASRCLRSVYLGAGIAAVYDFEAEALINWRGFDAVMRERMGRIGAL